MRVCCTILILAPLALCANVQTSGVRLPNPASNQALRAKSQEPEPIASTLHPPPSADSWSPPAFDRYDSILTRMPFGQAPAVAVNPAASATPPPPPPPAFVAKLTLCAINRTPASTIVVGFVDASTNPPHSYYLSVGEDENGFTVLSADIDQELATIEKDGIRIDLKMGKGATVANAAPSPAPVAPRRIPAPDATTPMGSVASAGPPMPVIPVVSPTDPTAWPIPRNIKAIDNALKMGIKNDSYVERLRKRREEVLAQQQQAAAADGAQLAPEKIDEDAASAKFEAFLRRKNLNLIRKGEPGLGIPLTPEEDAQLVSEGVLPTQK